MPWRNRFRKPPPPASPAPIPRAPVPVVRPIAYQAIPATPGNDLDASVVKHWLGYHRKVHDPSWSSFVADLQKEIADLEERVARAERILANYRAMEDFRP